MTGAVRLGRAYVNLLANLMMASFMPGCPMAEAFAMVIALLDWRHQVLVYRELRLAGLPAVFVRTADTAGAVLYLVAAAQVLTFGNLPAQSASCVQDMAAMPLMLLILLNFLLLLLGTVLEPLPAIIPDRAGAAAHRDQCLWHRPPGLWCDPVREPRAWAAVAAGLRGTVHHIAADRLAAERLSWLLMPFFIVMLAGITFVPALHARA